MAQGPVGGLHRVAITLAALSVALVLGVSVTAAVVQARDDGNGGGGSGTLVRGGGEPDGFDYSDWQVVEGASSASGDQAAYQVPQSWEAQSANDPVQYAAPDGSVLAKGHSTSFYYGNDCTDAGTRVSAAWAALADPDKAADGDDLVAAAEQAVRAWGRGYSTNVEGTTAPMTAIPGESVELRDGTPAGRARMEIDMTVFDGQCLSESAEIMVTSIDTEDGVKSLVQARYLLAEGGISDEVWDALADSFTPSAG